jgi:hypothetical protein
MPEGVSTVGPPIAAEVLKLSAKRSPAMHLASDGTLIKSKNRRNDQPENASQSKVTAATRTSPC